ncbi:hypothetical protein [Cryobacterium sp. SO1]|uniref:hypothetical protein n=1 Tax=Cryobacterium sp. SO1 TaxID=1897061 RepID=UPI001023989F|nr:hypothetical protein [Cryobacterium sp. SO1]RZI36678.1 hypothetical protein BJQ95_00894 [Cryobacterium sp. SO1]
MAQQVSLEGFYAAFPARAAYVLPEGKEHFEVVHFEVKDEPVIGLLGWALPNKDIVLIPTAIEIRDDGWVLTTHERRYLLKPMDQAKATAIEIAMEDF